MNCFRRWTVANKFLEYWPLFRPQYSWGFVRFCERVLNVPPIPVQAVRWGSLPAATREAVRTELAREFFGDWAVTFAAGGDPMWARDYFQTVIAAAAAFPSEHEPLLWVLSYGEPGAGAEVDAAWRAGAVGAAPSFPVGVAAVRPWPADDTCGASIAGSSDTYYELLFWVRPGYRTAEAGHQILPVLLERITGALRAVGSGPRYLMVRYAKTSGTASDSSHRAQWSVFFNDHDFFSYKLRPEVAAREVRLRRIV